MGNGEIISAFCAGQLRVDKELAQCRRIIHCTRDFSVGVKTWAEPPTHLYKVSLCDDMRKVISFIKYIRSTHGTCYKDMLFEPLFVSELLGVGRNNFEGALEVLRDVGVLGFDKQGCKILVFRYMDPFFGDPSPADIAYSLKQQLYSDKLFERVRLQNNKLIYNFYARDC